MVVNLSPDFIKFYQEVSKKNEVDDKIKGRENYAETKTNGKTERK